MSDDSLDLGLVVQLRDIPSMRVARTHWSGPPAGIGAAFERATAFAVRHGVGPVGPLIGEYPRLVEGADIIEANILVPMTRLPESDDPDVETVRLPRLRAACSMYAGPMGPEFRRRHAALFAWMDARGVPRKGTAHHHAYLAGRGAVGDWTVEIRVPVVGGSAPAIPL